MKTRFITLCISVILLIGSVGASIANSLDDAFDAYNADEYQTTARILTPLAKKGDAEAQYYLGVIYDNGFGVPQDYQTAVKWYTSAAEQVELGFLYAILLLE